MSPSTPLTTPTLLIPSQRMQTEVPHAHMDSNTELDSEEQEEESTPLLSPRLFIHPALDSASSPTDPDSNAPVTSFKHRMLRTLKQRYPQLLRLLIVAAFITVACVLIFHVRLHQRIPDLLQTMEHRPVTGTLLYIAVYFLTSSIGIPVSFMTLAGGYLFRPLYIATFVSLFCVWLSASIQFLVARYLMQDSRPHPKLLILRRAVESEGWKISVLLRLSVVVPFALGNYALAFTQLAYTTFAWTTVVATQPGLFVYTYVGSISTSLKEVGGVMDARRSRMAAVVLGGCVLVAVVWITCIARRAWRRTVQRFEIEDALRGKGEEGSEEEAKEGGSVASEGRDGDKESADVVASTATHMSPASPSSSISSYAAGSDDETTKEDTSSVTLTITDDPLSVSLVSFSTAEKRAMALSLGGVLVVWAVALPLLAFE